MISDFLLCISTIKPIFWIIRLPPELFLCQDRWNGDMTPTLNVALLCSSKAGSDFCCCYSLAIEHAGLNEGMTVWHLFLSTKRKKEVKHAKMSSIKVLLIFSSFFLFPLKIGQNRGKTFQKHKKQILTFIGGAKIKTPYKVVFILFFT